MKMMKLLFKVLPITFLVFLIDNNHIFANSDSLQIIKSHHVNNNSQLPDNPDIDNFEFDYHKFRLESNFGFSTRLGQMAPGLSDYELYFTRRLSVGMIVSISGTWFNSRTEGYGFEISRYMSRFKGYNYGVIAQAPNGSVVDNFSMTYLGPSYVFRQYTYSDKSFFVGGVSLGYLGYRENIDVQNVRYVRYGENFGFKVNMGYDYECFDKIGMGIKLSFVGGVLSKYHVRGNGNVDTYYFPDGFRESLFHMELSIGIRYLVPEVYYFK